MLTTSVLLLILSLVSSSKSSKNEESRRPIPISSSLPSTASLPTSLTTLWESSLLSLAHSTLSAVEISAAQQSSTSRSIASNLETRRNQKGLNCFTASGEWIYSTNPSKGLLVHKQSPILASCDTKFYKTSPAEQIRPSLHYQFTNQPTCPPIGLRLQEPERGEAGRQKEALGSRRRFCELIAHKSILLVGDSIQYTLHDLLLDFTTIRPASCYGDLYCKIHKLCEDLLKKDFKGTSAGEWDKDERVYVTLPDFVGRLRKGEIGLENSSTEMISNSTNLTLDSISKRALPHSHPPSISSGTLLRFRRSDGLRSHPAQVTLPNYVHPSTGVLEINQQWLADHKRSDITIITKSPLPLPSKTFSKDWEQFHRVLEMGGEGAAKVMIEAVRKVTEEIWLPELLDTLGDMRKGNGKKAIIIYRGSWRGQPSCSESIQDGWDGKGGDGPPILREQPDLREIIFRKSTSGGGGREKEEEKWRTGEELVMWSKNMVYYNLQIILQNYLFREIIGPKYGIIYLDLESALSVMSSGMVGGTAPIRREKENSMSFLEPGGQGKSQRIRDSATGDCLRYCFPSPGQAIERSFLGGLSKLLEAMAGGI